MADDTKTETPKVEAHPALKAVRAAHAYLMTASLGTDKFKDFRVEEIQLNEGVFFVTLSYDIEGEFGFDKKREYKEFQVTSEGEVTSMKIKKL